MDKIEKILGKMILYLLGGLICMGIVCLGIMLLNQIMNFMTAHTWALVALIIVDVFLLTREFYKNK